MSEVNQIAVLLKTLNIVFSIGGFFGALAVLALFKMAKDINSIKTFNEIQALKHDQLNEEHKELKTRVTALEHK